MLLENINFAYLNVWEIHFFKHMEIGVHKLIERMRAYVLRNSRFGTDSGNYCNNMLFARYSLEIICDNKYVSVICLFAFF